MDVPPLVTVDTWTRAQATLKANLSRRTSKRRINILKGLLTCAVCGTTMVCTPMREGALYYRCTNALSVSQPDASKRCKTIFLRAERIEAAAWELCKKAIEEFPSLDDWREVIFNNDDAMWGPDEEEPPERPSKEALEAAITKVDANRDDVMDLWRSGLITQEKARERLAQLNQEELRLKRRLDALAHRKSRTGRRGS